MCYLIHLGVPRSHADAIPTGRAPRVDRQDNPSIAAAFGPAFVLFSIAEGGCACSLYSAPRADDDGGDSAAKKRRKYERLGWSPARIARALAASDEARTASPRTSGLRQDVATLIAGIARTAGEVRLLVHHHHGRFGEEIVVPRGAYRLHAGELETSERTAIAEDTVYSIVG